MQNRRPEQQQKKGGSKNTIEMFYLGKSLKKNDVKRMIFLVGYKKHRSKHDVLLK